LALSVPFGNPPPRDCATFHGNLPSLPSAQASVQPHLSKIVHAGHPLRLTFRPAEGGQEHAGQVAMIAITTSNSMSVKPQA
jgi:hypothetical protein